MEGREQGAFARRPCSGGGRGGLVTLVQASNFGDNSRQGEAVEGERMLRTGDKALGLPVQSRSERGRGRG